MPGTRVYSWASTPGRPRDHDRVAYGTSLYPRRDCLRLRADSSLPMANQMELSMVKAFCCRYCRAEIEPIALADGSAALVCIDCDLIGIDHDVVQGAPMQPAGLCSRDLARAKPARFIGK